MRRSRSFSRSPRCKKAFASALPSRRAVASSKGRCSTHWPARRSLGDGADLSLPGNAEARARLEILLWEAGASALEVPHLGPWLWGSRETFDAMIGGPAHGTLRGRVLAARTLEVSVRGMPPMADPELVGSTLQVLQPLLLHPEPLVWVHAARALGRLTGQLEQLEGTLLDWVLGESRVLRQRAMTAFASLPAERLKFLASQLVAILESPDQEPPGCSPPSRRRRRTSSSSGGRSGTALAGRILAGDGGRNRGARAGPRACHPVAPRAPDAGDRAAAARAARDGALRTADVARRVAPLDRGHRGDRRPSMAPSAIRSISSSASRT